MRPGARDAQQATWYYGGLIGTRMDWLTDRILSISRKAPEISRFRRAARDYQVRVIIVRLMPEDDTITDDTFHAERDSELAARKALIEQVKLLADLPYPPRAPWHHVEEEWPGLLGNPDPTGQGAGSR